MAAVSVMRRGVGSFSQNCNIISQEMRYFCLTIARGKGNDRYSLARLNKKEAKKERLTVQDTHIRQESSLNTIDDNPPHPTKYPQVRQQSSRVDSSTILYPLSV